MERASFDYDAEERYYARFVEESYNDSDERPREPREPDDEEWQNMSLLQRRKYLNR